MHVHFHLDCVSLLLQQVFIFMIDSLTSQICHSLLAAMLHISR